MRAPSAFMSQFKHPDNGFMRAEMRTRSLYFTSLKGFCCHAMSCRHQHKTHNFIRECSFVVGRVNFAVFDGSLTYI